MDIMSDSVYFSSPILYHFYMLKKVKDFFNNHKSILWKSIVLLGLISFLIIMALLKLSPDISEWWSKYPARWYLTAMGFLTKYIPFSLTELFFLSTIAYIIVLIIFIIRDFVKKKNPQAVSKIISIPLIILSIITNYFFACGFAYNRKPIDLHYYSKQVDNSEFVEIYNYFVTDVNYCISQLEFEESGDVKTSLSIKDISALVAKECEKLDKDYYGSFNTFAKPMATSFFYRELQITGVTFASLGEANVNYLATKCELPITIAHEIAHTKGVIREDEANQLAFYLCLNSDNTYLRFSAYSCYFYQMRRLTSKELMTDEDRTRIINYDNHYAKAVNHMIDYWKKHDMLSKIGDFFNDLYIKMNGVKEGTDSYSGGTGSSIEPGSKKLIASKYQQLFFEKYYRSNNV